MSNTDKSGTTIPSVAYHKCVELERWNHGPFKVAHHKIQNRKSNIRTKFIEQVVMESMHANMDPENIV